MMNGAQSVIDFLKAVFGAAVDAVFRNAVAARAEVLQEPAARDGDPDKRGGFQDPSGNSWWVSTQQPA